MSGKGEKQNSEQTGGWMFLCFAILHTEYIKIIKEKQTA